MRSCTVSPIRSALRWMERFRALHGQNGVLQISVLISVPPAPSRRTGFSHHSNDSACEDVFAVRPKPVPSLPTKTSSFWGALRPGKSAILVPWPSLTFLG